LKGGKRMTEEQKEILQEWFADQLSLEDSCKFYEDLLREAKEQFIFVNKTLIEELQE